MKGQAIGIVNFHTAPDLSPLTDSRPLGSTSFLGRYAFCDFALSNLCNSGIQTVGLLVKDHPRSILKHLGSMDAWVQNTKIGSETILYNEPGHLKPGMNTDIQNLRENDWLLYDNTASYIVIVPSHLVCTIDLRKVIDEHVATRSRISVVATPCEDVSKRFHNEWLITPGENGTIASAKRNTAKESGPALVSLGIVVINRTTLADLIRRYLPEHPLADLGELINLISTEGPYSRHLYVYKGYVRLIESLEDYMDASFELLNPKNASALFREDWPIYTLTHDTPPALYGGESDIKDSFISNGAIIEGKVEHSIIARNVRVAKGAVVRNSILFSGAKIGEGCEIVNALIDKYAVITRGKKAVGSENATCYVKQGEIR